MKRTAWILVWMLLAGIAGAGTVGTQGKQCLWTFKASGERADGQGTWATEMTVTQRCYDFDKAGLAAEEISDRKNYAGYDYRQIGPPSRRQDCAGYTFQKLFGYGPLFVEAGKFDEGLVFWFGREIFRPGLHQATWGDVRAGDVLVFRKGGKAMHIAWVRSVETTAGVVSKIWVETKDGEHPLYLHGVGFFEWPNDPLVIQMGEFSIYRIDPSKVKVEFVSKTCDCGPMPAPGAAEASKPEGEGEVATADVPKVDDKGPSPPSDEQAWEGRWKGKEKATVVMDGIDPVVREVEAEFRIEDLGGTVRLSSAVDNKTSVLKKLKSNPNACMEKKERQEPLLAAIAAMGATGGTTTKETLVLFLREGRLYLAQRIIVETEMTQTIGEEKVKSHSRMVTDAIGIFDQAK